MFDENASVDLVTGGAGFLGSHVVDELLRMGRNVLVLDDLSGGFADNVNPAAKLVVGSVADSALVDRLFLDNRIVRVYHLAAYAAEGLSHFIRRFNYETNLIGSINLINNAVVNKVELFVFTSSIAVYGSGQAPFAESTTPKPEDPYGISKYAVELDLAAAHEQFGLNYVVFRPHNVYGERQNIGDRYRNVVGIFMNKIMLGEKLPVFGDGRQTRAFSYISDVTVPIARVAEFPAAWNRQINIGADRPYSVLELADVVIEALGMGGELEFQAPRNEVIHAHSDHQLADQLFGELIEGVSLKEGIQRMADWALVVGGRESTVRADIEIEEGMPPIWRSQLESPLNESD